MLREPFVIAILAAFLFAVGIAGSFTFENTTLRIFLFVFGTVAAVVYLWMTLRQSRVKLLPATLATFGILIITNALPFSLKVIRFVLQLRSETDSVTALDTLLLALTSPPTAGDYFRVATGLIVLILAVIAMRVQQRTISQVPKIERESKKPVTSATDRDLDV